MRTMTTVKTLLAILLVGMLSVLGMGVASADDGGLNNWTNSTRNQAGQGSLPTKAELTAAAQNKANEMARRDSLSGLDASTVPGGYSGLKSFVGKSSSATGAFQKWIADGGASSMNSASWTHIGSGVATSEKTGSVYAVQILATYAPPPPPAAPAPVPAPVQAAPAPAPVQVAPAPAPVQPAPVAEAPAPVEEKPAPVVEAPKETPKETPKPSVTPSATATPSGTPSATETPSATPEATQSMVPVEVSQSGQVSPFNPDIIKNITGALGIVFLLFAGFSGLTARRNRRIFTA